jgi:tetratricopeptide (TPR) repeat protein
VAGSLLRGGERLRVACRLVAAPGGEVLWSDTLDAGVDDLFGLQDEIARRVVRAVAPEPALGRRAPRSAPTAARAVHPGAYESFLRANQLAFNTSQWAHARDLYRAALAEDPDFAPAWARLGRVLRVMAKYGHVEPAPAYAEAERAFRRALELDPELPAAHNLFTYFEVEELGRARDAMTRLLGRARARPDDPELFAGLVTALRFCGLLEASVEADRRARSLDPGLRTSVTYTHLLRGDHERAMRYEDQDVPYVRFYSLPALGRTAEAVALLRESEARSAAGLQRTMLESIRAALEDRSADVQTGVERLLGSGFHDPEGIYLSVRHAAKVGLDELALAGLERVVAHGFHVPQALRRDPWLAHLAGEPRFAALLERAETGHREALAAYVAAGGEALLGAATPTSAGASRAGRA